MKNHVSSSKNEEINHFGFFQVYFTSEISHQM